MWKSFDDLASRVDRLEKPIMPLSKEEIHAICYGYKQMPAPRFNREEWQKVLDECKPVPYTPQNAFITKKEEEVSSSINLIMSAEKFAAFLMDLQELAPGSKTLYDKNGNTVYDPETGDYKQTEIPVDERWVELRKVRVNAEGKFVVSVALSTLNNMDQLNARRERIASYQA